MEKGSLSSYILVGLISGIVCGSLVLGFATYYPANKAEGVTIYQVPQGGGGSMEIVGSEEDVIINAYNRVAPSVVHITSTVLKEDIFMRVLPQEGVGSGVIVSPEGYILTNNHVIEDAQSIKVSLLGEKELNATLVGADPYSDLAVIKIDPTGLDLNVAALGDSDSLKVGMRAIAIGNPFRLDRTITVGVISALNRTLRLSGNYVSLHIIQTDASINPGNSGGPLVNSKGEVIGINTAIFSTSGGSQGIGFAIPINTAKKVMKALIENGKMSYPWMGISGREVTPQLKEHLNLSVDKGAYIESVVEDGPSDKAGLKGGDVIVEIDGNEVGSIEDIVEYILKRDAGDEVEVGYIRGGKKRYVKVVLGERE